MPDDVYQPPRTQDRFAGSARQVRGAVLRELLDEPLTPGELAARIGFPTERVEVALVGLEDDELVKPTAGVWTVSAG